MNKELRNKILGRLEEDNPCMKVVDNHIRGLQCPECCEDEGFSFVSDPSFISCPRKNNCGVTTSIHELYPDLFDDFHETYGENSAEEYLKARGIDTSLFEFQQVMVDRDGIETAAVAVKVDNDVTFYRFLDNQSKDKTRIYGSFKGKSWFQRDIDIKKPIYIVEGILNAWSLIQVGHQAIATLSSSNLPSEFYTKIKDQSVSLVLAFDNDKAGKSAVKKNLEYLTEIGIDADIVFPPRRIDWNDLLRKSLLDETALEDAKWRGECFLCESERDVEKFHGVLERKYPGIRLFDFKNSLWAAERNSGGQKEFRKVSNFSIELLYSILDDSAEDNAKISHMADLHFENGKTYRVRFGSFGFTRNDVFKSSVMGQARAQWFGKAIDHETLVSRLLRKEPPLIRQLDFSGYDSISDCYVFKSYCYDRNGKRQNLDKEGFYPKQKIKPAPGKQFEIQETDLDAFLGFLEDAYGDKGLLIFGFYISSLFSRVIFNRYGFFPYLMIYGDPQSGKSQLTQLLNRCFFNDSEGIPGSRANTLKGLLRSIAQVRSLVCTIIETLPGREAIDGSNILSLYNRNVSQVRAAFTNDNQIKTMEFHAALSFVQNNAIYNTAAAKERFISIVFKSSDLNMDTKRAFERLKEYSNNGIGDLILRNRKKIEAPILHNIEQAERYFQAEHGIDNDRISAHYAIAYGGYVTLCQEFDLDIKPGFDEYVIQIAREKLSNIHTETDYADDFFTKFEELASVKWYPVGKNNTDEDFTLKGRQHILEYGVHYLVKDDNLCLRLSQVLKTMKLREEFYNKSALIDSFRQHDALVIANEGIRSPEWDETIRNDFGINSQPVKVWGFNLDKLRIELDLDAAKGHKASNKV